MEFFNLNLNQNEIYKLYEFKQKYESKLINEGKLEEPQEIQQFIESLKLDKYAFSDKEANKVIPFAINDDIVIYSNFYDESFEILFQNELSNINYDINNLKQIDAKEIFDENSTIDNYFIINGNTYI